MGNALAYIPSRRPNIDELKILRCIRTNDWTSRGNEALVGVVEPIGPEDWLASLHPAGYVPMAGFGQWQRIAVATVGGEQ